ncbi:MAG: signal peptidase I [bacterium]|nr:signal peptidase I [bacterium]
MKVFKKIISIIMNIFTFIITLLVLFLLYKTILVKIYHKDYVSTFGYSIFEIVTGSMEPTLSINDYIIVKNTDNISEGDIITYKEENTFITHRIIKINGDEIITQGDANNSTDKKISKSMIIGKVVKVLPNLGVIKSILLTPKIIISMCIFILLLNLCLSYKPEEKEKGKL